MFTVEVLSCFGRRHGRRIEQLCMVVHGGQWLDPNAIVFLQWSIDGAVGLAGFGSASHFFLLCWCALVVP
jgi:hypothetical protein